VHENLTDTTPFA